MQKDSINRENQRVRQYFRGQMAVIERDTDRVFKFLLPVQWLAILTAFVFFSEHTANFLNATVIGGAVVALLSLLGLFLFPGTVFTRQLLAVGQMFSAAVLFWVTGGNFETYLFIFASLVLLSFYRDINILITASIITIGGHLFLTRLGPFESAAAELFIGKWNWTEHTVLVLMADLLLVVAIRRNLNDMWKTAVRDSYLEASEERYHTVIEQMTESIFLVDPETARVIDCNHPFVKLVGCHNVEEATQLTVFDFDPVEPEEFKKTTRVLREENRSLTAIRKFKRRNGQHCYVEVKGRLISYLNQKAICVNARDITKQKKAELELKRLALVAKKTQNAVVITDPEGRIEWVNEGFTRLTGFQFAEVAGRKPGSILQGEKTSRETIAAIRERITKCQPFAGEIYNYHKNGTGYWLSLSIMPINDSRGKLRGFISVEMDITERKAMEEKLRHAYDELESRIGERTAELVRINEQLKTEVNERKRVEQELGEAQQFLRKVIDDIPSLIFVKDIHGRFILVNRALARMFGTRPEKMIGKTYGDFNMNRDEVERYHQDDEYVINNLEERIVHEEKLTDSNGNVHWLQTIKRPLIGDEGVESIIGIATDFTERKILESQLRHSQKLESIGQLAAGIAHEINTPTQYVGDNARFIRDAFTDINVVLDKYHQLFEMVKNKNISEKIIEEIADEIENADLEYLVEEIPNAIRQSLEGVSRIAKIVQSMKDFAHPGTSEKKAADLNKAIESTITVARNEWKYVADVETNFDNRLPLVPCLLGEINQVVLNMVINASHAIADVVGDGSHGKGKITITTTRVNDKWAEIRIGDTGTGVPPEIQGKIFDPFFTTKDVGKGTGQGLAISHTVVVEKHHGQLSFESEPGQGTTFIIRLPLEENGSIMEKG
ncbi:MAG: PAS domain S-box protein [Acidobacteria bacterium]|nr:PAS domain S-box protein [Acidobacteriota bacterium]